jgi:two-component system, chemotaxis family, response regulator Rcp1
MHASTVVRPIDILLIEDNLGDARLTQYGFAKANVPCRFHVARNGLDALAFLRRRGPFADAPRPHLILLDLGLPKKGGHQVLAAIKRDPEVRHIPVVILTGSDNLRDIAKVYDHDASCYITKPSDPDQFEALARLLVNVWRAEGEARLDD